MAEGNAKEFNTSSNAAMKLRSKQCVPESSDIGRIGDSQSAPKIVTLSTKFFQRLRGDNGRQSLECLSYSSAPEEYQTKKDGSALEKHGIKSDSASQVTTIKPAAGVTSTSHDLTLQPKSEKGYSFKTRKYRRLKTPSRQINKYTGGKQRLHASYIEKCRSTPNSSNDCNYSYSPINEFLYSSRLSEPVGMNTTKSFYGTTDPYHSQKLTAMPLHMSLKKKLMDNIDIQWPHNMVPKPLAFPTELNKTLPNQIQDAISLSHSPQKKMCSSNDIMIPLNIEDNSKKWSGFPHRCVGYENLFQTDRRLKCRNCSEKMEKIQRSKVVEKKGVVLKPQQSKCQPPLKKQKPSIAAPKKCIPTTKRSRVGAKNRRLKRRTNPNKIQSSFMKSRASTNITNSSFMKSRARSNIKNSSFMKRRAISNIMDNSLMKQRASANIMDSSVGRQRASSNVIDSSFRRKRFVSSSGGLVPVETVPFLTCPFQEIIHDSAVLLLSTKNQGKKTRKTPRKVKPISHVAAMSKNQTKYQRHISGIKYIKYRQVPLVTENTGVWSSASRLKLLLESAMAQTRKRSRKKSYQAATFSSVQKFTGGNSLAKSRIRENNFPRTPPIQTLMSAQPSAIEKQSLKSKNKIKCKIIKTGEGADEVLVPAPISKAEKARHHEEAALCRYNNKTRKNFEDNSEETSVFIHPKLSTCDITKNISNLSHGEPQKAYEDYTEREYWDTLDFRKYSRCFESSCEKCLCSNSFEKTAMEVPRRNIVVPQERKPKNLMRGSTHKDLLKHAVSCQQLSKTSDNQSLALKEHSSGCTVTLIPSLLGLFNCIKTLPSPGDLKPNFEKQNEGPAFPKDSMQITLSTNSSPGGKDYIISSKNTDLKSSNMIAEEDLTKTLSGSTTAPQKITWPTNKARKEVEKNKLLSSKEESKVVNTSYCSPEEKRTNDIIVNSESKTSKKNIVLFQSSPTITAKTILRTGHIKNPTPNLQSCNKRGIYQGRKRLESMVTEMHNRYPNEENHDKSFLASFEHENKGDFSVLTVGLIFLTVFVQTLLYFSVSAD